MESMNQKQRMSKDRERAGEQTRPNFGNIGCVIVGILLSLVCPALVAVQVFDKSDSQGWDVFVWLIVACVFIATLWAMIGQLLYDSSVHNPRQILSASHLVHKVVPTYERESREYQQTSEPLP
jgi:Na+/melibiose symporter-like transporter